MNNLRFLQLGWVLAAALLGVVAAGGFRSQASGEKFAVVDISRLVEVSDFGKGMQEQLAQMRTAREEVLKFIDDNRVLTMEQAERLRDISLKPNASKEEKAELDRIKSEVVASNKRSTELQLKTSLTPEERTLLEEYAKRSQTMNEVASRWLREFVNEMQEWVDRQKLDGIKRARVAISDVAKAQGYSIVFEVGVTPYGANDLTDASLTAMNAKK